MSDEARVAQSDRAAERAVSRAALGFRPLYRQVKAVLTQRIADGVWAAGGTLPEVLASPVIAQLVRHGRGAGGGARQRAG